MRIRVMPREVFLGIESKTDGIHQFSIGVLSDHISSCDGVVLYTPNDDFSQCAVFAVAEVLDVDSKKDSCSLNVRNHSSLIRPIGTWNLEWATPKTNDGPRILEIIQRLDPDIFVITEGCADLLPPTDHVRQAPLGIINKLVRSIHEICLGFVNTFGVV
jgi:hypothetical protein